MYPPLRLVWRFYLSQLSNWVRDSLKYSIKVCAWNQLWSRFARFCFSTIHIYLRILTRFQYRTSICWSLVKGNKLNFEYNSITSSTSRDETSKLWMKTYSINNTTTAKIEVKLFAPFSYVGMLFFRWTRCCSRHRWRQHILLHYYFFILRR